MTRGSSSTGYTGTISFAAPEVLRKDRHGKFGDFTEKSDVFSLGMIVYFMCFGHLPYAQADLYEENENLAELRREVLGWSGLREERNERTDLPDKLYDFLELLLSHDPIERPTTEEILRGIRAGAAFSDHVKVDDPDKDESVHNSDSDSHHHEAFIKSNDYQRKPGNAGAQRSRAFSAKASPTEAPPVYLRKKKPDPDKINTQMSHQNSNSLVLQSQQSPLGSPHRRIPLLAAPPTNSWRFNVSNNSFRTYLIAIFKSVLFIVKIWSLTRPCSPFAPRNTILIPLIGLASLDLTDIGHCDVLCLTLASLHIGSIFLAKRFGVLCEQAFF